MSKLIPVINRFESKFTKGPSCWNWIAGISNKGYGYIRVEKKLILAHRLSYLIYNGEFDFGLCVLHKCDNRKCVNPNHLFLGTRLDNCRDMDFKKRRKSLNGSLNGNSKLASFQVEKIRELLKNGFSQRKIAKKFGVCKSMIGYIKRNENWNAVV